MSQAHILTDDERRLVVDALTDHRIQYGDTGFRTLTALADRFRTSDIIAIPSGYAEAIFAEPKSDDRPGCGACGAAFAEGNDNLVIIGAIGATMCHPCAADWLARRG